VRRAKETLGTHDIVRIVRSYSSRTFGLSHRAIFSSRSSPRSTLDRNPEKYFGALQKQSEARFQEGTAAGLRAMATLERALKIDREGCAR